MDTCMTATLTGRNDALQHCFWNPFQTEGLRREVAARPAPFSLGTQHPGKPASDNRGKRAAGVLHPHGRCRVAAIPCQAATQAIGVRFPPQPRRRRQNQDRQRHVNRTQREQRRRRFRRGPRGMPRPDSRAPLLARTASGRARSLRTRSPAPTSVRASSFRIHVAFAAA